MSKSLVEPISRAVVDSLHGSLRCELQLVAHITSDCGVRGLSEIIRHRRDSPPSDEAVSGLMILSAFRARSRLDAAHTAAKLVDLIWLLPLLQTKRRGRPRLYDPEPRISVSELSGLRRTRTASRSPLCPV